MTGPEDLEAARVELGLTVGELWVSYFSLGGQQDEAELQAYLHGRGAASDADHDVLVHALNERYLARGEDHPLAYRRGTPLT